MRAVDTIKAQARVGDIDMTDPVMVAAASKKSRLRKNGPLRTGFTVFPLLILPVLIYLLMALFSGKADGSAVPGMQASLDSAIFTMPMLSGASWQFRAGDALLLFALVMLSFEIVKSTSTRSTAIINHASSMLLLIFCLIGFLVFRSFATSVFFFMTMMTLLDVLAGVMVTIVSARRDFGVGDGFS